MHKHSPFYAMLLGLLLPVSAAAWEPVEADPAGFIAVAGDELPAVDEAGMEPVYAPGQYFQPPADGGDADGYGGEGGCPTCGREDHGGCCDRGCCDCCCAPRHCRSSLVAR